MIKSLTATFFIIFIFNWHITGQIKNENSKQSGEFSLRIKSISFVKNNEYFNPIGASKFILMSSLPGYVDKSEWIEGYTLLGYFFQPELVFSPSEKVTISAGGHFLKYSGTRKFSQIRPVFSTSINLSEKTTLTIGSLSGSDKHQLFDPHFSTERFYKDYVEDGFQLTSSNDHIFNDTWLSWENFIFKGDSTREVFTFGESFKYTSATIAKLFRIEIPVQVQFKHYGGQISNYPEHVETYFNFATGLRINTIPADSRFGHAGIEYLKFINNEFPVRSASVVSKGKAYWVRLHYTYKAFNIGVAYWRAHNFYAPNGNEIYASVIDPHSDYILHNRRIITNSFSLNMFPESYVELFLGLETYYDIDVKRMDNAITLHLNFNKLIQLAVLKH